MGPTAQSASSRISDLFFPSAVKATGGVGNSGRQGTKPYSCACQSSQAAREGPSPPARPKSFTESATLSVGIPPSELRVVATGAAQGRAARTSAAAFCLEGGTRLQGSRWLCPLFPVGAQARGSWRCLGNRAGEELLPLH